MALHEYNISEFEVWGYFFIAAVDNGQLLLGRFVAYLAPVFFDSVFSDFKLEFVKTEMATKVSEWFTFDFQMRDQEHKNKETKET